MREVEPVRDREVVGTATASAAPGGGVWMYVLGWLLALAGAAAALAAAPLAAQQAADQLTLEDAIALAKGSNPGFLSAQNDQAAASWQVREAYAQFLPSVTASLTGAWQEAGAQRVGTIVFDDQITDWYFSQYGINLGVTIDGNTIFAVPNARANSRATQARISAAEFNLESQVAFQYMAVLRFRDGLEVAERQLERAQQNLEIVQTRVATGAAAGTEGTQAEVELGRAEVAVIQAERDLRQARLVLSEQVGVVVDETTVLSSEFEVFEPEFDVEQLMGMALDAHPSLVAMRAQESSARAAARQASTSQYLPSLRLNARFSGQAQEALNRQYVMRQVENRAGSRIASCEFNNTLETGLNGGLPGYDLQDCTQYMPTEADFQTALSQNNAFPFEFTSIPAQLSATVSIPVFTGFSRERQVSQARNAAEDAEYDRRAEELRLRTAVRGTYDNLNSAYRVVEAEGRNLGLSEQQLLLQQRRYALGATGLLELLDAQSALSQAEQGYLNALYDFHYNLIALEASVGRTLRPQS